MNKRGIIILASGAAALVLSTGTALALAGGSTPTPVASSSTLTATTAASTSRSTTNSSPTSTSTTSASQPATVPGALTEAEARRLALAYVGGGTVTGVERETEHGAPEWKVRLTNGGATIELRINATTGAVTRVEGRGTSQPTPRTTEAGDDHGGSDDRSKDDKGGDNSGRDNSGHGSDDSDRDDKGGHGSDEGPGHK